MINGVHQHLVEPGRKQGLVLGGTDILLCSTLDLTDNAHWTVTPSTGTFNSTANTEHDTTTLRPILPFSKYMYNTKQLHSLSQLQSVKAVVHTKSQLNVFLYEII